MKKRKRKSALKYFLVFALICIAIIADSRYRIVMTEYSLVSRKVPDSFDGFRIVQLSDLHGAEFGENNERLLEKVREANPDIIALTGDFIDEPGDVEAQRKLYEALAKIAPAYFVSGNHDWASGAIDELRQVIEEAGCVWLGNESIAIERNGEKIILCGVEDPNGRADMKTPYQVTEDLRSVYPDELVVMLGHRNYWAEKYPKLDVDFIFCGHAHGGIIRIPFVGGLIGVDRTVPAKWEAGFYDCGRYGMVVSRGLGDAPILPRFLNNPQIVTGVLETK